MALHSCHEKGWFLCPVCQNEVLEYLQNWMVKMPEYRKSIPLDANTEYWFVELGVLSARHGGASYPFPSYEAARKFAFAHKRRDIDRDVSVIYPDGSQHPILWHDVAGQDPEPYVRDDLLGDNQVEQQAYHPVPEPIITDRITRIQRGV